MFFIIRRFIRESEYLIRHISILVKTFLEYCRIFYWRCNLWLLLNKIKTSTKIVSPNYNLEIMSITSHDDLILFITMLKSFIYYSGLNLPTCVFDDGTLTQNDKTILNTFFNNIRIITKKESKNFLSNKISARLEHYINIVPYLKKKVEIPLYATYKRILILDSDLIFFEKPNEIINWIKNPKFTNIIYMQDIRNSYMISEIEAKKVFKRNLIPQINSGIIGFPLKYYDLKLIEKFVSNFGKEGGLNNVFDVRPPQLQVLWSLMFSRIDKKNINCLDAQKYILSEKQKNINGVVCRHYVRKVRKQFYYDAVRTIGNIAQYDDHKGMVPF